MVRGTRWTRSLRRELKISNIFMPNTISLSDKDEIIQYHKRLTLADPNHTQSETIRHFLPRFRIPNSTFTAWLQADRKLVLGKQTSQQIFPLFSETSPPVRSMVECLFIQYYAQLKLDDPKRVIEVPNLMFKKVVHSINRLYPKSKIPNRDRILNGLFLLPHIDLLVKQHHEIQSKTNNLARETYRLRRLFKPYDPNDIFHYTQFTIDISLLIRVCAQNWDIDGMYITVGYGVNFTASMFLPPLIVYNFCPPSANSIKSPYLWYNETGTISCHIFRRYLGTISKNLSSDILLVTSASCMYFPLTRFANITLAYKNIDNFPLDYGLDRLILKNCQMSILIYLHKEFESQNQANQETSSFKIDLDFIPSMIQSCFNNIVYKCKHNSNYNRLLKHSVKLCFNSEMRTNVNKYLEENVYSGLRKLKTEKYYRIIHEERMIKAQLSQLNKKSVYKELGITHNLIHDLEHIIRSNMSCKNFDNDIRDDGSELETNFHQIFNIRKVLEANTKINRQTFDLFDKFYNSLCNNIFGVIENPIDVVQPAANTQAKQKHHENNLVSSRPTRRSLEPNAIASNSDSMTSSSTKINSSQLYETDSLDESMNMDLIKRQKLSLDPQTFGNKSPIYKLDLLAKRDVERTFGNQLLQLESNSSKAPEDLSEPGTPDNDLDHSFKAESLEENG